MQTYKPGGAPSHLLTYNQQCRLIRDLKDAIREATPGKVAGMLDGDIASVALYDCAKLQRLHQAICPTADK